MHATAIASTVTLVDITRVARDVYAMRRTQHLEVAEPEREEVFVKIMANAGGAAPVPA